MLQHADTTEPSSSPVASADRYPVAALCTDQWKTGNHQNGVVAYTTHLVEGMEQLGARPYVVANNVGPDLNGDGAFVRPVPTWADIRGTGVKRALAAFGRRAVPGYTDGRLLAERLLHVLRRAHREDGIEIFECEESCGVARLLVPRCPVPVVVRLHGPWFLVGPAAGVEQNAAFRRRVEREKQALLRADGLSAPSRDVVDRTQDYYGIALPNVRVIPNPIGVVPESQRWTQDGCEPRRLLFVGRFDRGKGADILLEAFAQVLREEPDARLTMAGRDHGIADSSGKRVNATDYIARRFPDPEKRRRIEWLGPRTPEELIELRRRSFCCVLASRYESFSMVTLEAMASGCPIVAPDVGGIPELLRHEHSGLLFPPGDADELAGALMRLMRSPAMAADLGARAMGDANTRHSPTAIARRTLSFYREIHNDRARRPR